jgi:biotin carboxyl carrier protein
MSKRHIAIAIAFLVISTSTFSGATNISREGAEFDGLIFNNDGPGGYECLHATLPVGTMVMISAKDKDEVKKEKVVVKEKIAKPLPGGKLESRFGKRRCRGCSPNHKGVDYTRGSKVVAALDGEVAKSGWGGTFGRLIVLNHKDVNGKQSKTTLYGHLRRCKVKPGQKVKKGQTIGIMGSTGRSNGPHLHFEIANNKKGGYDAHVLGRKENPLPYLNGKPVGEKVVEHASKSTTCEIVGETHFSEHVIAVPDSVASRIGLEKPGLMKVAVKVIALPKSG